jgi:AraC family transcriptional regulator
MTARNIRDLPTSSNPGAVLAHCPAELAGLPITVLPIPAEADAPGGTYASPCIFVAQQAHGQRSYVRSGKTVDLRSAPRMIDIYEAGLWFDRSRWQGTPGRCVFIEFSNAHVEALTHGERRSLDLVTKYEVFDDRLSRLTLELANETLFGNPRGDLYVQGLCISLLGALTRQYSEPSRTPPSRAPRRLSSAHQRRLVEFVQEGLGTRISLGSLAAQVHLSPQHFARVFKASFGMTAHEYVLQMRIEAAVQALHEGLSSSLSDVALSCGFSSHSHMAEVLRRHLGMTPSEVRIGPGP